MGTAKAKLKLLERVKAEPSPHLYTDVKSSKERLMKKFCGPRPTSKASRDRDAIEKKRAEATEKFRDAERAAMTGFTPAMLDVICDCLSWDTPAPNWARESFYEFAKSIAPKLSRSGKGGHNARCASVQKQILLDLQCRRGFEYYVQFHHCTRAQAIRLMAINLGATERTVRRSIDRANKGKYLSNLLQISKTIPAVKTWTMKNIRRRDFVRDRELRGQKA